MMMLSMIVVVTAMDAFVESSGEMHLRVEDLADRKVVGNARAGTFLDPVDPSPPPTTVCTGRNLFSKKEDGTAGEEKIIAKEPIHSSESAGCTDVLLYINGTAVADQSVCTNWYQQTDRTDGAPRFYQCKVHTMDDNTVECGHEAECLGDTSDPVLPVPSQVATVGDGTTPDTVACAGSTQGECEARTDECVWDGNVCRSAQ